VVLIGKGGKEPVFKFMAEGVVGAGFAAFNAPSFLAIASSAKTTASTP
jgi:hypothetical protein